MRHVVVMSVTASLGLVSVFLVDFVDLYFISLLGDTAATAAVGYAGTLIFFNMSATIGLMIAVGALASRRIGRGDPEGAREIATDVLVLGLALGAALSFVFFVFAPQLLEAIGASGEAKARGVGYLRIVALSLPAMVTGMVASGLLRAHGDAKRAMNATLVAGLVNAILDPIFIFTLGLGVEGAALASVCARLSLATTALWPILKHYGGFAAFDRSRFNANLGKITAIAAPAVLTNVATPIGAIIITRFIAHYGDDAIAGFAVITRLTPLAFCVLFALSGAVGPIVGQNFGAGLYGRVRQTLRAAFAFAAVYTTAIWIFILLGYSQVAAQFGLGESGTALVKTFAFAVTPLFFFNGVLFIANAAFNNLNRPIWSTILNWGRNTLGAVPFAIMGAHYGGAPGVLLGQALGALPFAAVATWLAIHLVRQYETGVLTPPDEAPPATGALTAKAR